MREAIILIDITVVLTVMGMLLRGSIRKPLDSVVNRRLHELNKFVKYE